MTPEEATTLLMFATTFDGRLRQPSEEEAVLMRRAWGNALGEVPFPFARAMVERYYTKDPQAPELKIAHVLQAWRASERVEAAKDREPMLIGGTPHRAPEGFAQMVAESRARWDQARQAAPGSELWRQLRDAARTADAEMPAQWVALPVRDDRERRCGEHKTCLCTHTACRDGWLDREEDGRVVRCPVCREAVEMKAELAPKRRGRR